MKIVLCLFACVAIGTGVSYGQFFGEMDWQHKKIPALIIDVQQPVVVTRSAITNKLEQRGYKPVSQRGTLQYKGIQLAEIGAGQYDLLIGIDKNGRRSYETSIVKLSVSKGNQNFVTATDDPALIERMKSFASHLGSWAAAQSLELNIQKQEDALKAAEKRMSDLETESLNLEKRKARIEEDIQTNKHNKERQKAEVENQKKVLEVLRAKRAQ